MEQPSECAFCKAGDTLLQDFLGDPLCPYCFGTFAGNQHRWDVYGFSESDTIILKSVMGAFNILERRLKGVDDVPA